MDLSALSLAQLKELFAELPKVIAQREKNEKIEARKALEAFAAERGFALDDLIGGKQDAAPKTRAAVAPKYKNPETGESWAGRGRCPKWLEGKNKEDYKI